MSVFGLLVNPRDGQPYYAEKRKARTIAILSLDDTEAGEGYFNSDKDYAAPSMITELPRVHTPDGVSAHGTGTGTVLYTSLCLAAHLESDGSLTLSGIDVSGDGISSGEPRSASAGRWWRAAREKYGLVKRVEGCAKEQFEEDNLSVSDINDVVASALGTNEVDVDDYTLSATGTKEECGLEADAYLFEKALHADLVVGTFDEPRAGNWADVSGDDVTILSKRALAGINTGSLRALDGFHEGESENAIRSILRLAERAGLSRGDKDGLYLRWLHGVDEDMSVWKYPDFEWVLESRENPGRGVLLSRDHRGHVTATPTIEIPARIPRVKHVPPARVKFYGRRPNPVDRAVTKEIERLHALRAELGWGVFRT